MPASPPWHTGSSTSRCRSGCQGSRRCLGGSSRTDAAGRGLSAGPTEDDGTLARSDPTRRTSPWDRRPGDLPGGAATPRRVAGPPAFVVAGVDDHPAQPGLEPLGVTQPRKLPPRSDDGLLGRILGSVRVPRIRLGECEEPVRGRADERSEGIVVPPHRPLDLLDAHRVPGSLCAARIDDADSGSGGHCDGETLQTAGSDLTSWDRGRVRERAPWREEDEGRGGEAAACIEPSGGGIVRGDQPPGLGSGW